MPLAVKDKEPLLMADQLHWERLLPRVPLGVILLQVDDLDQRS